MKKMIFAAVAVIVAAGAVAMADSWQDVTKKDGLPNNEIQFLKQDDEGTIWIGTNSGLARSVGGKFEIVLKDGQIWDVIKYSADKTFVGTNSGVVTLTGGKSAGSGLSGSTVSSFVRVNEKTVWALARSRDEKVSVVEFSGSAWMTVDKFKEDKVGTTLFRASDGAVYVSVEGDGVWQVPAKEGLAGATRQMRGRNVTSIFEDSKKRVWFGTWQHGLTVFDGKEWTQHLTKELGGKQGLQVFTMLEDKAGTIWVATNARGLFRYDGTKWTNDLADEGGINMIETTSDGRVWISSQMTGGLRFWDGKKWTVSLESPNTMRCLLETKDKAIWAGGILDGIHIKK